MDSLKIGRRGILGLPAFLLPFLGASRGLAAYGGEVGLSLPFRFDELDPSDPFDIVAALLGDALFEPLFRRQNDAVYPTLADGLPVEERGRVVVRLRPKMSFSSGAPLDAAAVRASLERSRERLRGFLSIPEIRVKDSTTLEFGASSAPSLGKLLAEPLLAIRRTGADSPTKETTGPFRVDRLEPGRALLVRNARCPRGGAFLDRVTLTSASLDTCLRDFELGKSAIGYQGFGLHHDRKDARSFRLGELGLLLVTGLENRTRFSRPGALGAVLASVDRERLGALGVVRSVSATDRTRVDEELGVESHPLLRSIGDLLGSDLGFVPREFATVSAQRTILGKSGVGANLVFVRAPEDRALSLSFFQRALHFLDSVPSPSSVLDETPEKLVRRLRLGLVGRLAPSGGVAPSLRTPESSPFDLGNSTVSISARRI